MIYIYGASGHGKVIYDCLEANGIRNIAFIDDNPNKSEFIGLPVYRSSIVEGIESSIIFGIGDNNTRRRLSEKLNVNSTALFHPSAIISNKTIIGSGTVIFQGAVVQADTNIGRHCIINTKASVDHDCVIGDYVHISPGATVCGGVSIDNETWIGAGSTIIQGIKIGKNVIIGAGSVIRKNIPDNVLVAGNPARIIKKI
ncbi:acetyltransferase [Marinifilum fragile]|uniref:acetyltransferase n=1 Tax=Marinifilum fragile TaxID=570161 RepID=UPI002AA7A881|nr:acetyltransferase [Marinifilum fragile]